MDAREFLTRFGSEEAERIALKARTNLAYFKQIAYGHRRPSVELAQELVVASDERLDFTGLMLAKSVRQAPPANGQDAKAVA